MAKVAVYDVDGVEIGEIELADEVFAVPVNAALMHEAVKMYLANQRVGTASTRTRGEVRGGGRKPWRQKGTGRARQGSIRAPHWKGGGTVFGPKPRDYRYSMPRKARRNALKSALSARLAEGGLKVVDSFALSEPKTKRMRAILAALGAPARSLLVTAAPEPNVYKSARNLPGVNTAVASDLNVYDVLNHRMLVLTRDAVLRVQEVLGA